MKLHLEVRAGEGGKDAQLLVDIQASIYLAYARRVGASVQADKGLG